MPYRKVGVIPQPTPQSNVSQLNGGQSSRKQGITMEDLKKQTALRLAQEQQQSRFFPVLTQQRKEGASRNDQQQQQHIAQQHVYVQNSTDYQQNTDQQPRIVMTRNHATNEGTSYQSGEMHQAQIIYQRCQPSMTPGGNIPDSTVTTQRQLSNAKSKLPHGLTVQELKEMTKARLQAEAAERHDKDFVRAPPSSSMTYQHHGGQQHFHQQNTILEGVRDGPCDSSYPDQSHGVSKIGVSRGFSQDHILRGAQSSQEFSGPPGFRSLPSQGSLNSSCVPGRDSWHQQPSKEAWETGSLGSHNSTINSDYLGRCESPYTLDEFNDISFNRTPSYPSTGSIDRHFENVSSGASYFEKSSGLNANRRRASTLSPRQGLSYLHENRISSFGVDLSIPFDSEPRNSLSAGLDRNYEQNLNGNIGNFSFNRPRTSSAPSVLPFVSNDMFGDRTFSSGSIPLSNHDLSKSLVESILGDSLNHGTRDSNKDFSSVFRSSSQEDVGNSGELNPWGNRIGGLQTVGSFPGDGNAGLLKKFDSVLSLAGESSPGSFRRKRDPEISLFPTLSGGRKKETPSQTCGIYGDQASFEHDEFGHRKTDGHCGF
eukprot:CAMPEP_0194160310 /NCGR_PEP_ID=MMETSP0152-20130528/78319_1 /TAXON_ID=1049557 /ORGANISM="Thalassiothrix antarctica, Strain L6-D1" /LENGTH=595 /DNA_ID=CAMNT_0038869985 /DNA_START=492 /DNA_END=2279 /DNA_ORIENTATION=+